MPGDVPGSPSSRREHRRSQRWSRRFVVAAALAALVVIAWTLWHRAAPRPLPRRGSSAAVAAIERWRLGLVSSLGDGVAMKPTSASVGAGASSGAIGVCGKPGGVLADESADAAPDPEPEAESASVEPPAADAPATFVPSVMLPLPPPTPAEQRILEAMRHSSDALARAAVLVLAPSGNPDDPSARLGRLAETAAHTSDPRVYGLAYRACGEVPAPSRPAACDTLSAAQWARQDGGNGMPWLSAFVDAIQRSDSAAADEALFHIAGAARIDDGYADVGGAVAAHVPPDDDAAALAGWGMTGRSMSLLMLPPSSLIERCKAWVDDANRHQLCAAAADKLIDHGNSLILQAIGAGVDRVVTRSAVRADRLRAERDALLAPTMQLDFSCDGLRRFMHRFRRSAQIGELAALREARAQAVPMSGPP